MCRDNDYVSHNSLMKVSHLRTWGQTCWFMHTYHINQRHGGFFIIASSTFICLLPSSVSVCSCFYLLSWWKKKIKKYLLITMFKCWFYFILWWIRFWNFVVHKIWCLNLVKVGMVPELLVLTNQACHKR